MRTLEEQGFVVREGKSPPPRGRPAETFHIRGEAWSALGIDFEMPDVDVVLINARGERLNSAHFATSREVGDSRDILETASREIRTWLDSVGTSRPCAVGVGFPGYFSNGELSLAGRNMPDWRQVPVRAHLERTLQVPIFVGHDVHFMALAEVEHRGWDDDVVLYLALRPGLLDGVRVGACLVVRGRPYLGGRGNGGALFRAIVPPEALVGAEQEVRSERIAEQLASSLVHLIPMADPDHVVFHGGPIGSLEPLVISHCERMLRDAFHGEYIGAAEISPALVRGTSGAERAAVAATRELLTQRGLGFVTEKGG